MKSVSEFYVLQGTKLVLSTHIGLHSNRVFFGGGGGFKSVLDFSIFKRGLLAELYFVDTVKLQFHKTYRFTYKDSKC